MLSLINPYVGKLGATMTIGTLYGGVFATATLILLLSLKEIVSASEFYDEITENSVNSAIAPLLIVFFVIVVFKTLEVLYP